MINTQLLSFIAYLFSGIIICIVFDLFRSLRKGIKTSNIATYIEDVLFWVIAGLVILFVVNKYNYGELRVYTFLAMMLGAIVYFFTISKYFIKFLLNIILMIKKIVLFLINFFLKFIGKPVFFLILNLKKKQKIEKK